MEKSKFKKFLIFNFIKLFKNCKIKNYKIGNYKGFTLVEILVSASIFVAAVTMAVNVFLFTSRLQRLTANSLNVSDNISSALEVISREIRMAKTRTDQNPPQPMFTLNSPSSIDFTNYKGQDVVYRLNNEQIERSQDGGLFFPLTSSGVKVESLNFAIDNIVIGDNNQPLVRIFLKVSWSAGSDKFENYLQTAVSPRNLDID